MKVQKKTIQIFQSAFARLTTYYPLIQSKTPVIAYSGGKDSVLLAHFYQYLFQTSNSPEPILFHLDHLIRNNLKQEIDISVEMKSFANKAVLKKNIPELSKRIKKSLEETGRLFRYKILRNLSQAANGYIVTGHHANDYLETLFINLIRGGGYSALGSLPIYRDGIFRPLMVFSETEMDTILKEEDWKIFADESNEDEKFLRNRIRKNILPLLKKEGLNPDKVYENFHNREKNFFDQDDILGQNTSPSFLRMDRIAIEKINLGNLKRILDAYASILKIHPFTKSILIELKKELDKKTSFLIENKEVLLWKSPTSDLFLIPQNSIALKKAKLENSSASKIIHWNGKTKEIPAHYEIGYWVSGMKIGRKGKHCEISELLREKQIPIPIREHLPILFKEKSASLILFSLWDDRLNDFIGD